MHLQNYPQSTPSWKHSQYFLMQNDLRHEHPFPYFSRFYFAFEAVPLTAAR